MSLSEVQEIYRVIQEIDAILKGITQKTDELHAKQPQTEEAIMTFEEGVRIAWRFNVLMAHMGFPPDIQQAINLIKQLAYNLRMLNMSLNLLIAETPYGMIMGLIGLTSVGLSMYDMVRGT